MIPWLAAPAWGKRHVLFDSFAEHSSNFLPHNTHTHRGWHGVHVRVHLHMYIDCMENKLWQHGVAAICSSRGIEREGEEVEKWVPLPWLGYTDCNIPHSSKFNATLNRINKVHATAKYLITYINLVVNITLRSGDMRCRLTTETNCREMHSRLCLPQKKMKKKKKMSIFFFPSVHTQLFYLNSMKSTHSRDVYICYVYYFVFIFWDIFGPHHLWTEWARDESRTQNHFVTQGSMWCIFCMLHCSANLFI